MHRNNLCQHETSHTYGTASYVQWTINAARLSRGVLHSKHNESSMGVVPTCCLPASCAKRRLAEQGRAGSLCGASRHRFWWVVAFYLTGRAFPSQCLKGKPCGHASLQPSTSYHSQSSLKQRLSDTEVTWLSLYRYSESVVPREDLQIPRICVARPACAFLLRRTPQLPAVGTL